MGVTSAERDPRRDPQAGDVLQREGTTRTVLGRNKNGSVRLVVPSGREPYSMGLRVWKKWAHKAKVKS